jgi:hypothetical protein
MAKRGCFILFEGVDRCGKTTQANRLVETLTQRGQPTVFMRFPDRETTIGAQIDAYLRNAADLDDHAVHLLFSANRWEKRCVACCRREAPVPAPRSTSRRCTRLTLAPLHPADTPRPSAARTLAALRCWRR